MKPFHGDIDSIAKPKSMSTPNPQIKLLVNTVPKGDPWGDINICN